jgi:hypothetical protein
VFVCSDLFPGGGSPLADAIAIAIAVLLFALIYFSIELIDRV